MPIYEFGNFRLDTSKRLLLAREGVAALTPKAYDTLAYLIEHAGVVLEKETIMRAIWPDTAVEENNLTQNISLLRRVLGEGRGENRFIATVPGRGYQFLAAVTSLTPDLVQSSTADRVSVAVLPFANISADPEFDYFADGLADELINMLSRAAAVRVAARTSAFLFKGKQIHIREIAAQLGVSLVLEGSVRKSGSRARITAQLVNAADGYQLWSERYECEIGSRDLFDVQDEITVAVLNALRLKLPGQARACRLQRTESAKAHELYLKGRFHLFRMTDSGIHAGIRHFEDAIEADPGYAPAHVGLAHAYRMFGLSLERPPIEVGSKAKAAALQAIAIDQTRAEAHAVLAFTIFWHEWDWGAAEEHFRRAFGLDPNSADTHWMYAHLRSSLGRHGDALEMIGRARELDPLSGLIHAMEAQFLLHAGRPVEAAIRAREAIELEPRSRVAHLFASGAHIEQGRFSEAVHEARISHDLCPSNSSGRTYEAYAHARAGRQSQADKIVSDLVEVAEKQYVPCYNIALVYNALGRTGEALEWLERAVEQKTPWLVFLGVDPKWKNLRRNPRYLALLRRLSLPTVSPLELQHHNPGE